MHPETAGTNWKLDDLIYDDGDEGIAVALFTRTEGELALGFRWLSQGKKKTMAGQEWPAPFFGKSSEWMLLPHDFAVAISKVLIEKKAAGMQNIHEHGFQKMIDKLKSEEAILDFIGY